MQAAACSTAREEAAAAEQERKTGQLASGKGFFERLFVCIYVSEGH